MQGFCGEAKQNSRCGEVIDFGLFGYILTMGRLSATPPTHIGIGGERELLVVRALATGDLPSAPKTAERVLSLRPSSDVLVVIWSRPLPRIGLPRRSWLCANVCGVDV